MNPNPVVAPPDEPHLLLAACERVTRRTGGPEELRVSVEIYEGNPYVSIRVFYRDRDGVYRPTRRGVSVRVRELAAVTAALAEAHDLLAIEPAPEAEPEPPPRQTSAGAAWIPRVYQPETDDFDQGESPEE